MLNNISLIGKEFIAGAYYPPNTSELESYDIVEGERIEVKEYDNETKQYTLINLSLEHDNAWVKVTEDELLKLQSVRFLKNDLKVRIVDFTGKEIIGTIQGNDLETTESINDLNYYVVPLGKTFNDEIMVLWSDITIIADDMICPNCQSDNIESYPRLDENDKYIGKEENHCLICRTKFETSLNCMN